MRVQDGEDYFRLAVAERLAAGPAAGDVKFAVQVRVSNSLHVVLTAESSCWVHFRALGTFAEQLHTLDQRREGSAVLDSMSPGELRLEIRSTDRAGHMVASGEVGRWLGAASGEPYWSAVAFRVSFCPSELPALAREFSDLAAGVVSG